MTKQQTILLVEDDSVDVMSVERALKKNEVNHTLFVAENGEEALDYLRRKEEFADSAASPRPDLILMDLNMPRMGGLELLDALKSDSALCDIPVVVLTSSDEDSDVQTSFERGAAGYIVKPTTFEKFVEAFATICLYWTLSKLPRSTK